MRVQLGFEDELEVWLDKQNCGDFMFICDYWICM